MHHAVSRVNVALPPIWTGNESSLIHTYIRLDSTWFSIQQEVVGAQHLYVLESGATAKRNIKHNLCQAAQNFSECHMSIVLHQVLWLYSIPGTCWSTLNVLTDFHLLAVSEAVSLTYVCATMCKPFYRRFKFPHSPTDLTKSWKAFNFKCIITSRLFPHLASGRASRSITWNRAVLMDFHICVQVGTK